MKKIGLFLGLASILAVGVGNVVTHNEKATVRTEAAAVAGDVTLDIGINFQSSGNHFWGNSDNWAYGIRSIPGSIGDSVIVRMRNNLGTGCFIDLGVEFVGGYAFRANRDLQPGQSEGLNISHYLWWMGDGTPFAVEYYTRANNTPLYLPENFDGYYCFPKSQLTRVGYGALTAPDWSLNVASLMISFYTGTSDGVNPVTNVDVGDAWLGNSQNGSLELLSEFLVWSDYAGTDNKFICGWSENGAPKMARNNTNLIPAVKLYRAMQGVDACNVAQCTAFVTNNEALINEVYDSDASFDYLSSLSLKDYAPGDTLHEAGKIYTYSAIDKLFAIELTAYSVSASNTALIKREDNIIQIVLVGIVSLLAVSALLVIKKKKFSK
jgi:hypothetical protein